MSEKEYEARLAEIEAGLDTGPPGNVDWLLSELRRHREALRAAKKDHDWRCPKHELQSHRSGQICSHGVIHIGADAACDCSADGFNAAIDRVLRGEP